MGRWIIAICPMCGHIVDVTRLTFDTELESAFVKSKANEWVNRGLTIEIRNEGHFPVSLNPCDCVRDPSFDEKDNSILSLLDEAGVMNTGLLDSIVHDVASRIAAGVNNSSSSAQVRFITKNEGDRGAKDIVSEVLDLLAGKQEVEEEL